MFLLWAKSWWNFIVWNVFIKKFASQCYACHQMILPNAGEEETVRIVAFDWDYHLNCYRCVVCCFKIVKHNLRVRRFLSNWWTCFRSLIQSNVYTNDINILCSIFIFYIVYMYKIYWIKTKNKTIYDSLLLLFSSFCFFVLADDPRFLFFCSVR